MYVCLSVHIESNKEELTVKYSSCKPCHFWKQYNCTVSPHFIEMNVKVCEPLLIVRICSLPNQTTFSICLYSPGPTVAWLYSVLTEKGR